MENSSLNGKVALVTGASGGIGGAIARRLVAGGASVIGTRLSATPLGESGTAADAINATPGHSGAVRWHQLDQRSPAAIAALVDTIAHREGRLDILVNNAAWNVAIPFNDLDALSPDLWDRVLETNLRGPFLLARSCASLLKADGGGHIVNISSIGGITPMGSSIAYACSKAALNHLTHCLAVALAPDVAVNCIASGLVASTRMADRAMDAEAQKAALAATLRGTGAHAEDIAAQVVAFVESRSVTGQTIAVDGGVPAAMR